MKYLLEFLDYCTNARQFSPRTAENYAAAVEDLERTIGKDDPAQVTAADFDTYMTRKALQGSAPSTRRSRAHALRSFFGFLASREFIEKNPAANFRPPEEKTGTISTFTTDEIQRLIFLEPTLTPRSRKETDEFFERRTRVEKLCNLRDSAMFGLSYAVGLRSAEIATIRVSDLTWSDDGECRVKLFGKGAREPKSAFVGARVAKLLEAYLLARQEAGIQHPALFCAVGPRPPNSRRAELGIDQTRVANALQKRIRAAGIAVKGRRLTPHAFRYSLATHLYAAGFPVLELKAVMRHARVETTLRYIALGSVDTIERKKDAKMPWNQPAKGKR